MQLTVALTKSRRQALGLGPAEPAHTQVFVRSHRFEAAAAHPFDANNQLGLRDNLVIKRFHCLGCT